VSHNVALTALLLLLLLHQLLCFEPCCTCKSVWLSLHQARSRGVSRGVGSGAWQPGSNQW